jgi:hypothetical protein
MIFVSYSRSDIADTRSLVESLSTEGLEYWLDEWNIPVGQAFVERLGNALREADGFLLVDTPASRSSYWVSRELQTALRYRREGRYHTALRLYSADCEDTKGTNWDISVPVNEHARDRVAKFLAGRHTARGVSDHDVELGGVSILNNTGLGQPSNWTGRQQELHNLDQWWFGSSPGAWLCGPAGTGKSGLLQTWVTALSCLGYDRPVSASVLYLAGRQMVDVSEAKHALFTWESKAASPRRLLLVEGHDEARSTADLEEVLEQAFRLGARALVTSRSPLPQPLAQYFTNVSLDRMTRRDSVAILSQFGVTGPESEQVAAELGDHPLALFIFSLSVARGNQTAAEALEDLRRMREGVSTGGLGLSHSIRATLRKSVQGLTSDARLLLESLSSSAEEVAGAAQLARPAIRELANAGLLQVDHFEAPGRVSIHPLVRRFINEERGDIIDGQGDGVA